MTDEATNDTTDGQLSDPLDELDPDLRGYLSRYRSVLLSEQQRPAYLDELKRMVASVPPLNARSIRQHFDLRSDQQGFIDYDRMRWVAGADHCPSTPDSYSVVPLPTRKSDVPRFRDAIAERHKYALYVTERTNDGATQRVQCPALYGTVGCALRAGTEATAIQLGQPIITNPPDPASPEGLPACCTQTKISTTPEPRIRKTQQRYYWGSEKWAKTYDRRTFIEGVFSNLKKRSTENLSRDLTRGRGLPWMNLIGAMTAAS